MDLDTKQPSDFRLWVRKIYNESCLERDCWNQKIDSIDQFWKDYKYWLKREFKYQRKKNESTGAR
jgi:hypothetical protein